MSKGISNTSRTLRYIRERGWPAEKVEQWNPYAGPYGIRHDLFGCLDIIALGDDSIVGIQSCGQDVAAHNRKILEEPKAYDWLTRGGSLMLIGWRKIKLNRGGKAKRWAPRIIEYRIEDGKLVSEEQ